MDWKALRIMVVLVVTLAGCRTTDGNLTAANEMIRKLKVEKEELRAKVGRLELDNNRLQMEHDYQRKRATVLEREKVARIAEIGSLSGGTLEFYNRVVSNLRELYNETVPVDYLGSEVCPRAATDQNQGCLFVDMEHVLPSDGTLVGGRAFIAGPFRDGVPVQIQFCILRPDEQGQLKVQWLSDAMTAEKEGYNEWRFDPGFLVYAEDIFGVYSAGAVQLPYDDADTGNVLVVPGKFKVGSEVVLPPAADRNRRAYSIGVTGYFHGR